MVHSAIHSDHLPQYAQLLGGRDSLAVSTLLSSTGVASLLTTTLAVYQRQQDLEEFLA